MVKQGEGTLVLPAVVEKYTGETNIWNGTLKFDGTLESSPLWLNRHTTLKTNNGKFMGGLTADYNATIYMGETAKSTLTTTTMNLNFGSRIVFKLFSDGSCDKITAKAIKIEKKDWSYGPKYSTPVFEFRFDGTVADGKYLLAEVETVEGDLKDIVLEGITTKRHLLSLEDGKLYLNVEAFRQPATVVWAGTESNEWDYGMTLNFKNNGNSDYSGLNDNVVFNDDAQQTSVVLKGGVYPASVTFDNNEKDITLTGDSILNAAPITKNGNGTVTIKAENRTGNTVINAGRLNVDYLANSIGQPYGALGDIDKTITINNGATLGITETAITDQQFYIGQEATIDVATDKAFSLNKGFKSDVKGTLNKNGAGTMTLGVGHTIKKLVINGGRVNAVPNNNIDQIPDTVVFNNGVMWSSTMDDTPGRSINANFIVPEGGQGTFYGPYRGTINGKLKGSGTLTAYSGGIRCYWNGDWSEFEGTLIPALTNRQAKPTYDPSWDWNNDFGLPKATLQLNEGVTFNYGSRELHLGSISGKGEINGTGAIYVGGNDQDIDFQGTFNGMAVVKTGNGTWPIDVSHQQQKVARLFVNGGILSIYSMSTANSYLSSQATVTVNDGGTLVGSAFIQNTCNVQSGGTMTIGRLNMENPSGEMKFGKLLNLRAGATLNLHINNAGNERSSRTYLTVGTTLTINGTVNVTLADNYVPKSGDEILLWTASTFAGTPTLNLPELPEGLSWDTTSLLTNEGKLKVVGQATAINLIPSNVRVTFRVYTLNGQLLESFTTKKSSLGKEMHRRGFGAGTYIVEQNFNGMRASQKVVIR